MGWGGGLVRGMEEEICYDGSGTFETSHSLLNLKLKFPESKQNL